MKNLLFILITVWATQSMAQDGAIRGSIVCNVVASKLVATIPIVSPNRQDEFPLGMSMTLEYTLGDDNDLMMAFLETDSGKWLIQEPFPTETFKGISPYSNIAEFRAPYSEASVGRFGINYKGSDQLFIKNGCGNGNWRGHFIQTYVGGHHTQVVSLDCRVVRDASDEILSRLKGSL